jgi:hypothetical protein
MRIYRDIIKQAWLTLWRYAWLWPFGLLAALAGNGGEYGSILSAVDKVASEGNLLTGIREALISNRFSVGWQNLEQALAQSPGYIIATLFLAAVTFLIAIWLIFVSQAALIKATGKIDAGESITFSEAAIAANHYFWPVLLLNILLRFAIWLLLAVAILPFLISYLAKAGGAEFDSLIIVSFLIFIPLSILVSFIIKYAVIAVVLDNKSWWAALERAVNLFFRNWLVSLEMAGLMFAISTLVGIVVYSLVATSLLTVPVYLAFAGLTLATLLKFLPQILLLFIVGAWFSTFQFAAWTILYRRLTQGAVVAKLERLTDDIPRYIENWFKKTPASLPAPKRSRTR